MQKGKEAGLPTALLRVYSRMQSSSSQLESTDFIQPPIRPSISHLGTTPIAPPANQNRDKPKPATKYHTNKGRKWQTQHIRAGPSHLPPKKTETHIYGTLNQHFQAQITKNKYKTNLKNIHSGRLNHTDSFMATHP